MVCSGSNSPHPSLSRSHLSWGWNLTERPQLIQRRLGNTAVLLRERKETKCVAHACNPTTWQVDSRDCHEFSVHLGHKATFSPPGRREAFKTKGTKAGEREQFEALVALTEDPGSIPRTHRVAHNHLQC